ISLPSGGARPKRFARTRGLRDRYHAWLDNLPTRVSDQTRHLDDQKELGHFSEGARRLILGVIITCSLLLAVLCITQPFNPLSQFIFLMLLWG
ncbi:hypothetical protein MK528_11070, partial [Streptococcus gordonii]|nr:hypothetical protein [Streptococcus gordonii]